MTKTVLGPPEQATSTVSAQRTSTDQLRRTAGVVVALLAAWCFVAGAVYSVATPIFEAPDEPFHFAYVRWLASGRGLPVVDPLRPEAWRQEGTQPPLYYAIGALLTGWIDAGDLPLVLAFNPHARLGVPDAPDNRNAVIHTPRERFPYRGSVLAVHLLRLFSAALAALTVLASYTLAKAMWPQQRTTALLAAALVAVNPMFVFVSASVNNDALATLLATACLALTVSATARPSRWGMLAAGAAGGLALLAKLNTAWVIPLAALYTGIHAYRREGLGSALRTAGATLLAAVAVAGWWLARNLMVYGDPTGLAAHLAVTGSALRSEAAQLLDELAGLRFAFWGIFGWFNVVPPLAYYIPFWGAAGAGLAGLALRVLAERRRSSSAPVPVQPDRAPLWLLIGAVISALGSLVWWTFQTQGAQGRLLFPAWPAAAILLVYGWEQLAGGRRFVPFGGALVAAQAMLVAVTPFAVIAPAYQLPASFQPAASQARPSPAETAEFWQYDGRIALRAAELPGTVRPGDPVVVTLHWRTLDAPGRNLSVYVQVLAPSGRKVGQRDSFPGGGLAPTVYWRAGDEFIERIAVPLESDLPPGEYTVLVGLYDLAPPANLFLPAPASGDRIRDSRYTVAGRVRLESMPAAGGRPVGRPDGREPS